MRHRLQPLAIFMNRQDSITLGKIIFSFTFMFLFLPWLVLVKKVAVPEWMPQLLVSLIWALTFITGKMDDNDKSDTRLYKILDSLLICVLFPLMLWSIAAVFNH